jgi:Ca2+-binding RTX toxin-like protein
LIALLLLAWPAAAAAERCHGEKVTISFRDRGAGDTLKGTAGRDVILGGPRSETIDAGGGEDVVCGGAGHEIIDGGPGRDELDGEDGPDTFVGRDLAQDVITGGVGDHDIAKYGLTPAGIRLNLRAGRVQADGARFAGGVLGIEEVIGTGFADHLVGAVRDEEMAGGAGNDVIDGRGGQDRLRGGADIDTVTYQSAAARVRLGVVIGRAVVGEGDGENADFIREFEIYIGSKFDDELTGSDASEKLVGGVGDDTLRGGGDGDTFEGGPGDDTIHPGEGDDLVDGGPNNPVKGTGAHGDLVSYQAENPHGLSGSFDFYAHLLTTEYFHEPPGAMGVGDDPFVGVESIRGPHKGMSLLEGDGGPNVLIGGSSIDVIDGYGGNDLLFGLGSNDDIDGSAGDDYLAGGEPHGEHETDKLDGGDGDDTCVGAREQYRTACESID